MSAVSTVTTLSWNERVAVDEEALQTLLDRWRPVVSAMYAPRPTVGGERDDLGEEGMIGLFTAIRDYDMSIRIRGKFDTMWDLVLDGLGAVLAGLVALVMVRRQSRSRAAASLSARY